MGSNSGCFVALPAHILDRRGQPQQGSSLACVSYDPDVEHNCSQAMLDVCAPVPLNAKERFARLTKEWPEVEVLAADSTLVFGAAPPLKRSRGRLAAQAEDDAMQEERKIEPDWRVFLVADPVSY